MGVNSPLNPVRRAPSRETRKVRYFRIRAQHGLANLTLAGEPPPARDDRKPVTGFNLEIWGKQAQVAAD